MNLKRLWDTENKKTVRAIPTGDPHKKFQVWTNDDGSKLYVYANSKHEELNTANASVSEYGPTVWKTLDDETVGYYLTNEPTDLYNWDEGDDVTYTFKDYDGTVLKTGKIEEGQTPTPPADPTRAATAQYTYTFAGWNPTVGPISKKTTYTATYTRTVNKYTITATSSDADLGTVSPASVANVEYGTALTVADNVITVGTGTSAPTITATAGEGNTFEGWGTVPATVTGNTSVEAAFSAPLTPLKATFYVEDVGEGGSEVPQMDLFLESASEFGELPGILVFRDEDPDTHDVYFLFTPSNPNDSVGIGLLCTIFESIEGADRDLILDWGDAAVVENYGTIISDAMTYINAVYALTDPEIDPTENATCQALATYLEGMATAGNSILEITEPQS